MKTQMAIAGIALAAASIMAAGTGAARAEHAPPGGQFVSLDDIWRADHIVVVAALGGRWSGLEYWIRSLPLGGPAAPLDVMEQRKHRG